MKKLLLLFLLLMISSSIFAPAKTHFLIIMPDPVSIYDKLIKAVLQVECGGNYLAYNPEEEATGPLQIRPIRLNDYNKKTGKNYKLHECYNFHISKEIFMYYVNGRSFEIVAKEWNGSGPKTIEYWKRVKRYL